MREKLWYRCAMCSPNQSRFFEIDTTPPTVEEAYRLVMENHNKVTPTCPLARGARLFVPGGVCVEFLVRPIQ